VRVTNRKWVWFFVLVGTLTVLGAGWAVWSNLNQQLTPEKLAAVRARWEAQGPRDYDLDYEIKREANPDPAPRAGDRYTVRVRDGKVESVLTADGKPPRPGEFEFGGMDDLFDRIEQRLRADRQPGAPRAFFVVTLRDDRLHYVRSVMTTRERLELNVTLKPITASPP
jgi:hypothetical protein